MAIPRGLIIYKAARHRENFPLDMKYGYYSDKISSSLSSIKHNKRYANFHRRSQKKLVQNICFKFFDTIPNETQALQVFSRFNGIRKCTIHSLPLLFNDESKRIMIKTLQRLFKGFKRIKRLAIYRFGSLQKSPKGLKNLLLLNQLESLMLSYFEYSPDPTTLLPFVQAAQQASKRKCWPNLKSLKISPLSPDETIPHCLDKSLQNLLEFLQRLKSCEKIYECSSLQMVLPDCFQMNSQQAEILLEVSKLAPSLTKVKVFSLKDFSGFFNMCQNAKDLRKISLKTQAFDLEQNFDINSLRSISTLQKLKLSMYNSEEGRYRNVLPQIKMMTDLTALSLEFCGRPAITDELKRDLVRVISKLSELRNLKLAFSNSSERNDPRSKEFNSVWLGDVFEEISEKKKLEKLSLTFCSFGFEKSSRLFKILCKALGKLTQLTHLSLQIMNAGTIDEKEIFWLCQSFTRLDKLQSLKLRISKRSYFSPKTFAQLIDCIAKKFPFLTSLVLGFSEVQITRKTFAVLYQAIKEMGCLNWIRLMLDGRIEEGVDMKLLAAEIRKGIPGNMQNHLKTMR